jgi:ribosomal protein S18 acetylase RimI-like enzyme
MAEVRTLTLDDYDAIIGVWRSCGLKIKLNGRESRVKMQAQMQTGVQTILGAVQDGQLAGVVLATHDGRKGWINRLGVARDFQRQGIARTLVQAAEAHLRGQGISVVCVLIEQHNAASLSLFESEGFKLEPVVYLTKRDSADA